ncbi:MAG: DNA-processing protein DprA [Acidimicrobiia bacterium]
MTAPTRPDPARPEPARLSPEQVAAATLACLPEITPVRMRALLDAFGGAVSTLDAVLRGHALRVMREATPARYHESLPALMALWTSVASDERLPALLARRRTNVFVEHTEGFPVFDAPDAPAVLLAEGAGADAFVPRTVAVVGTRAATPQGLADAYEIGAYLARAGCTVVSRLAIGIDGAAHEGALDAGGTVVGVVGTGLDVVYPRRHRSLFERVRAQGLLVSELGYGVGPRKQSFPIRNRIIAGCSEIVVVVEATARGGARITADKALAYGRTELAMPGSRRNPAAAGTNQLLYDGAQPLLDPNDLGIALSLTPSLRKAAEAPPRRPPEGDAGRVLRACAGEPVTLDELASRTGFALDVILRTVRGLEREGWVVRKDGLYWPLA